MDEWNDKINWSTLFRAVIRQAAKDAFILHNVSKKNKKEAFEFLTGGMDLEFVCDICGADYDKITYLMKNLSKNNNINYIKIENEIK